MSKPRIEIYNSTSGISIQLSVEAAYELVAVLEGESQSFPDIADKLRMVIQATENNKNATEYVERA